MQDEVDLQRDGRVVQGVRQGQDNRAEVRPLRGWAMTSKLEKVARAICPHLREGRACLNCLAEVQTDYGTATNMCRLMAQEAARAAISAHEAALAEEGMVIVPRVPTEAMIEHGRAATAAFHSIQGSALTVAREKMRRRFIACVDAAPTPPKESA
jgi:hypothetical protein